jgi:ankyrin repeat protein
VGIVRLLLECGADPNSPGRKGTTPLMYAKTKIDEKQSTNFELLEILISFGAALRKRDNFDKDIFDYLAEGSNVRNYLREKYAIL